MMKKGRKNKLSRGKEPKRERIVRDKYIIDGKIYRQIYKYR